MLLRVLGLHIPEFILQRPIFIHQDRVRLVGRAESLMDIVKGGILLPHDLLESLLLNAKSINCLEEFLHIGRRLFHALLVCGCLVGVTLIVCRCLRWMSI